MGGSPCKAWDWRNPIVQTLFTQGPTRTAVLRARRDSRTNGRGCPSASARGGAVVPPGPGGRGPGLFRLWTAIYQRPASDPVGREGGGGSCQGRAEAPTPRGGRRAGGARPTGASGPGHVRPFGPNAAPPPAEGGKTAQAGQKRQRPAGGRRAGGARPAGAFGPGHVRPFGPNAAPPRRGRQNRPGRAKAPTSRGGAPGGRSPPGGGLWPPPCSALRAERRPPPPGTLAYRALSLAPSLVSSTP